MQRLEPHGEVRAIRLAWTHSDSATTQEELIADVIGGAPPDMKVRIIAVTRFPGTWTGPKPGINMALLGIEVR